MRVLPGRVKANQHLAFSPDGQHLVCGGNGRGVAIWNVATSDPPTTTLTQAHGPLALHFDTDTGRLYAAFHGSGVWTRTPAGVERKLAFPDGQPSQIGGIVFAPDGSWLTFSHYQMSQEMVGTFKLTRHALDGDRVGEQVWQINEEHVWDGPFAYRSDAGLLVGARASSRHFVSRNPADGATAGSHPYQTRPNETIAGWTVSPDGDRVAFTTRDRVRVLDLATGGEAELPVEEGSVGRSLAYHPGGQFLAVAAGDGVKLLDAGTLAEVRALSWGNGRVRTVAFAPDGMTAATAGERGWVTVWDVDV
ncbi:wd-40 repeat protein : Transcriptional regulator, XRE family OS=Streptomyces iranensis GN=SIRAN5266 PE=4 SV=1: WD40: PD40: WD40 [Gemmataceae bacterium]|nr:wd-40 repeat protein : Transcriptional regulator, XRE family OS=Streptomyces iranensis GN=SIRAN5266 PE=4 SV=1: WD40: PD40: WD40 [Gemmataceae bacterium]VTU01582.1 wd-40 repeat protein : Transcriptional regulator, XRE family OS=Streptomyces iranensis GN=SIRAN5266 PE=4 SV=1: WD40: PD40: WD40 [Gemmataceae bacterium]